MMILFRCQIYLAGQRPTDWEHHLYHSKVNGDLSHDRHTHTNTQTQDMFLSEKMQKPNFCRC